MEGSGPPPKGFGEKEKRREKRREAEMGVRIGRRRGEEGVEASGRHPGRVDMGF